MSEKKYKYTVKKFAKMLTVHPDKLVTFEDMVDVRRFFTMRFTNGGPWHNSLSQLLLTTMQDVETLVENETSYWSEIVEHGEMFATGHVSARLIRCEPPFHLRVEFDIPAATLAGWLAATGFPQMSRAKEVTGEDLA